MSNFKKLMMTAAGGEAVNVEDVFSTYLYEGNSSTQTITNGIDLDGEGGMVWIKSRNGTNQYHMIFDTERGVYKFVYPAQPWAETNGTPSVYPPNGSLSAFNSNGFTVGSLDDINGGNEDIVSWTFRKAPKFFDVITFTYSTGSNTISHNLGSTPGMIFIKRTDSATGGDWWVWHTSLGNSQYLRINNVTQPAQSYTNWCSPTSTNFTLANNFLVNGGTYVAYIFAHNNGDGEFGPNGDQDIIKCGSYTANESSPPEINLGFEPQWILIKKYSDAYDEWALFDNMRGVVSNGNDAMLRVNTTQTEYSSANQIEFTPTGFKLTTAGLGATNAPTGEDYLYIAIRRGPMAVPESATDVFDIDTEGGTSPSPPAYTSGFPVDMGIYRLVDSPSSSLITARLTQDKAMTANTTNAEFSSASMDFDFMDGWFNGSSVTSTRYSWMWRRAPNFFDVVCYTGTGSAQNITHNLGATPEFYIVKRRDSTGAWYAYHKDIDKDGDGLPETDAIQFNGNTAAFDSASYWNDTAPTETTFTVGTTSAVNASGGTYIAYLFTSLDGVAKVGGYTGNGTSQTINCGFAPRFVFLTAWGPTGGGPKLVFDTERGIVAGNDPFLDLRSTAAQDSSYDFIDPDSNGFVINTSSGWVNDSGQGYMFYAIA